jgi:hypothetical protein
VAVFAEAVQDPGPEHNPQYFNNKKCGGTFNIAFHATDAHFIGVSSILNHGGDCK